MLNGVQPRSSSSANSAYHDALRLLPALALAFVGCGETTQSVGKLKAAASAVRKPSTTAGTTTSGLAQGATASTSASAGQTASPTNVMPGQQASPGASSPAVSGAAGSASGPLVPAVGPPPGVPCQGTAMPATLRQFDIYMMIDTNISIPLSGAWDNVAHGLSTYVDDTCSAGVSVAVRYFGVDCSPSTYTMPTTPMGMLPDNASAIKRQIPVTPFMVSPTLPALQGALTYASSRANAYPDSKQIVVLVSDGFYDFTCQAPNLIQSIFTAVKPPASGAKAPTYVLALDAPNLLQIPGLSQLLSPTNRFGPLDTIAQSGGTGSARHIDLEADPRVFAQALVDIQHDAQPCDYVVPDALHADPAAMDLGVNDAAMGQMTALPRVADAAACGACYYLDAQSNPSRATLCPATCAQIKSRCDSVVWVTGCKMQ